MCRWLKNPAGPFGLSLLLSLSNSWAVSLPVTIAPTLSHERSKCTCWNCNLGSTIQILFKQLYFISSSLLLLLLALLLLLLYHSDKKHWGSCHQSSINSQILPIGARPGVISSPNHSLCHYFTLWVPLSLKHLLPHFRPSQVVRTEWVRSACLEAWIVTMWYCDGRGIDSSWRRLNICLPLIAGSLRTAASPGGATCLPTRRRCHGKCACGALR